MIRLLQNHVLANLLFGLVLVVGILSYSLMPREQDPTINFNWIDISTVFPGASATDVETRVTDILEDAVRKISDIKFVTSSSREGISNIVVRFDEIDERTFDKRLSDLRREIQNQQAELPDGALDSFIFEVTTANAFPTATIVVSGPAKDEELRKQSARVLKDIERIKGVDRILPIALPDPEIHIDVHVDKLDALGLSLNDVADTLKAYLLDMAAGSVQIDRQNWLVRLVGSSIDPVFLANLPITKQTANGAAGEIKLGSIADVKRGREKARQLVSYQGQPAVILSVTKQAEVNILVLVNRIQKYIDRYNAPGNPITLTLADDQTEITRSALSVMQKNAALGLFLVLLVTWIFLGWRIALMTSIGIPFVLAGTFWLLHTAGFTLNVSVLLGVVISLGMLVDDAVVVVESIYYRLQRGMDAIKATLEALSEVFAPVLTSVLTTMAAFLPLMLLPGILGQFMLVIPLVVTLALAISLVEAFWILPVHVIGLNVNFKKPSRMQNIRVKFLRSIRHFYARRLLNVLRHPIITLIVVGLVFSAAVGTMIVGKVAVDFFASDPIRLFYVNVQMPAGTPIDETLRQVQAIEKSVRKDTKQNEARSIVSYAGQMFTETAPFFGDQYGQILVSLNPKQDGLRSVDDMIESMRVDVESAQSQVHGPARVWFLRLAGGPPTTKPINVKVRGDKLPEIRAAADELKTILAAMPAVRDISDDDNPGQLEYNLSIKADAARRAGLNPAGLARTLRLLVDGEIVTSIQHEGEKIEIRVRAKHDNYQDIGDLLNRPIPTPSGVNVPLSSVLNDASRRGPVTVRHYNFRRTISVKADIDKLQTDVVTVNNDIKAQWETIRLKHPNIDLDFSGLLDDLEESLAAIKVLFLFGIGLIYLILGTQFKSYFQPLMILVSVPLAFTGVVLGLLISGNPLSLYTLYGVIALAGISVNAAIVLISAANDRLQQGMSLAHATVYAGRRRVVPILITSLTTIAGLFSLATGLGGESLLWGPVATSIVWGLSFSTILTLFVIPLLFRLFMKRR